ncbi:hypothetical protein RN001_002723 [Aquatica leii]|uniref:MADF domain-containing protein n=1 Tax=Aquatica leii TaxID=1421715 RepID=A0AAN7PHA2_9COLE|nr:hypothetical protein RN001_002723 [Aquatica leii]
MLTCSETYITKNKHARSVALQIVQEELFECRPNTTIIEIKLKFNDLKTTFMTEYRKMIESKKSGAGDENLYKPTIWYFDHFLTIVRSNNHFYDSDSALYTVDVDDNVEVEYQESELDTTITATTHMPKDLEQARPSRKRKHLENDVLSEATNALQKISLAVDKRQTIHAPE